MKSIITAQQMTTSMSESWSIAQERFVRQKRLAQCMFCVQLLFLIAITLAKETWTVSPIGFYYAWFMVSIANCLCLASPQWPPNAETLQLSAALNFLTVIFDFFAMNDDVGIVYLIQLASACFRPIVAVFLLNIMRDNKKFAQHHEATMNRAVRNILSNNSPETKVKSDSSTQESLP